MRNFHSHTHSQCTVARGAEPKYFSRNMNFGFYWLYQLLISPAIDSRWSSPMLLVLCFCYTLFQRWSRDNWLFSTHTAENLNLPPVHANVIFCFPEACRKQNWYDLPKSEQALQTYVRANKIVVLGQSAQWTTILLGKYRVFIEMWNRGEPTKVIHYFFVPVRDARRTREHGRLGHRSLRQSPVDCCMCPLELNLKTEISVHVWSSHE